jgi:hypothetical protein
MEVEQYNVDLDVPENTLVVVPENGDAAASILEELLSIGIPIASISVLTYHHKFHEALSTFFSGRPRSMAVAGIGGVHVAGFLEGMLREPSALEGVRNGLTEPLGRYGIPGEQADRYAQDIVAGRIVIIALVPRQKMPLVTSIITELQGISTNNISIRVASVGDRRVAQITEFLAAFERAYNGLLFFESLSGQSMMRYLASSETHSVQLTSDRLRLGVWPNDRVILQRAQLSSPGFWEFFGKLNPLEIIRLYLNDRHERCKDKKYREANEAVRLQLENALLANKVIKERLAIARSVGLTKGEMAPLINGLVLLPMNALSQYQDDGLIENVELVDNPQNS